jgi:hypothetical protein
VRTSAPQAVSVEHEKALQDVQRRTLSGVHPHRKPFEEVGSVSFFSPSAGSTRKALALAEAVWVIRFPNVIDAHASLTREAPAAWLTEVGASRR